MPKPEDTKLITYFFSPAKKWDFLKRSTTSENKTLTTD